MPPPGAAGEEEPMQAIVKRAEGLTFLGRGDTGHWVVMDGRKESGGADGASSPKELVLLGLGACTAFDVEGFLRKRRADVRGLAVEMDADVAADPPKVFTEIRLAYRIEGDVAPADAERAIRLSQEKYCAVSAMLRRVVPIRWTALVNGREIASGVEGGAPHDPPDGAGA
jgi:putative redox protein